MTRLAICASILIACGDGGETPGQTCGDGVVDAGEECDDGNSARGDGCFECVLEPPECGNAILDFNEDCDDGNTDDGDGCSATCELEIPERHLMATWAFKNLQGNVTTACPVGFPKVIVQAMPMTGTPFTETFDCSAGTATTTTPIPPGHYDVSISVVDAALTGVYANSLSQAIDLSLGDAPFTTTIFNDAGFFDVGWQLQGAISLMNRTCAQATATTVRVTITGLTAATDNLPCVDGGGITSPLLAGTTYSLTFQALDAAQQLLGSSTALTNQTITAPNAVTDLGTTLISITNQ